MTDRNIPPDWFAAVLAGMRVALAGAAGTFVRQVNGPDKTRAQRSMEWLAGGTMRTVRNRHRFYSYPSGYGAPCPCFSRNRSDTGKGDRACRFPVWRGRHHHSGNGCQGPQKTPEGLKKGIKYFPPRSVFYSFAAGFLFPGQTANVSVHMTMYDI